jgi:hypothetical protein
MTPSIVSALVRHLLTGIAGAWAVKYGVDGSSMDAIISGVSAAAGVGWSILDKKRNAQ